MTWLCRFGEDEDEWIEFECAGQYPSYVGQIFVESHAGAVEIGDEFFMVQVKRPNSEKISTVRVDIDFIPKFTGVEVESSEASEQDN